MLRSGQGTPMRLIATFAPQPPATFVMVSKILSPVVHRMIDADYTNPVQSPGCCCGGGGTRPGLVIGHMVIRSGVYFLGKRE